MFTKKSDKPKHLYLTGRPRWASLVIDLIAPLTLMGGLAQMVFYPDAWQVTFVAGVVVFGIINQARYDTKLVEDELTLLAMAIKALPKHRLMDVAGIVALLALQKVQEEMTKQGGGKPAGLGVEIGMNEERYVLTLATREHFDKMTEGNVNRGAPDLRIIH